MSRDTIVCPSNGTLFKKKKADTALQKAGYSVMGVDIKRSARVRLKELFAVRVCVCVQCVCAYVFVYI